MSDSQHQPTARLSASAQNAQPRGKGWSHSDDYDEASGSHSYHALDLRDCISTRISPPPLMRQRTESKATETTTESSRYKPLSNDHIQTRREAQYSLLSGVIGTHESEQIRHERSSESLRQSFAFLKPLLQREYGQRNHSTGSIDSDGAHSGSSTRTSSLSKRTCRMCEKGSATNYNPIITCLGCDRPYHDSCRRPPLIDGVDLNCWRCSKCLAGSQRRFPSGFDAPGQHIGLPSIPASQDVTKLNSHNAPQKSFHVPPVKERKEHTRQVKNSTGTNTRYSDIIPSAAPTHDRMPTSSQSHGPGRTLDHAKKPQILASSSKRHGSKVHEIPNTPTQLSCAPDISNMISEQQPSCTSDVDSDHDTPLSHHNCSRKRTVLTMLCSVCKRERVPVNPGNFDVKCLNCRKKDVVSAAGRSEIPETPGAASSREGHFENSSQIRNSMSIATSPLPVRPATNPWFRSRRVTPKPTAVQETLDDYETSPVSMESHATFGDLNNSEPVSNGTIESIDQAVSKSYSIHVREQHTDKSWLTTTNLEPKQLDNAMPTPNDIMETTKSTTIASNVAGSANLAPRDSDRLYTNRELVRIAMIAADRPHLTAVEIADWLAHSFSYLKRSDDSWKKSVKAALPTYPEFLRNKVQGGRVFYSLVDGKTRTKYEKLYPEYCASPRSFAIHSSTREVEERSRKDEQVALKINKEPRPFFSKAIKSAPTPTLSISRKAKPDCIATPSPKRALAKRVEEDGLLFMPFERRAGRQPQNLIGIAHEARREIDFYSITPRDHESPVDRMSQAEKDNKIAEIKARPSRKSFFGPDHVLAHARRYKRQDIHDERDGAWQPKRPNQRDDASKFEREMSLKELFNLPENAIPMNDGPSGLAFRDGTLINGRLPRPRQIYRVSKAC